MKIIIQDANLQQVFNPSVEGKYLVTIQGNNSYYGSASNWDEVRIVLEKNIPFIQRVDHERIAEIIWQIENEQRTDFGDTT